MAEVDGAGLAPRSRRTGRARGRTRLSLLLAALSVAHAVAAPFPVPKPAPPPAPLQPDALVEIRSYGEAANELIELLVPFLAKQHFGSDRPRRHDRTGVVSAVFVGPSRPGVGGDFIVTTGTYNCVLLAYYTAPGERSGRPADGIGRAVQFRIDLEGYLRNLPTPRVATQDIAWESKRWCR